MKNKRVKDIADFLNRDITTISKFILQYAITINSRKQKILEEMIHKMSKR